MGFSKCLNVFFFKVKTSNISPFAKNITNLMLTLEFQTSRENK